jgi:predicted thioesterase
MNVIEYIQPGVKGEAIYQVEEQYTATHVGSGSLQVLATPSMIAFMERVSHSMLEECLPAGYSSVGIMVDMHHLAPTPVGSTVRVVCEVLEVDDRRVTFVVEIWDEKEKAGEGKHQRVVIDVVRFLKRVEAKGDINRL